MATKKNKRIPKVPIHGKAAHNGAFLVSIGNLIVNWANNESVFLAMLQTLVSGGAHTAAIIWHSHRTSNAKLDLVLRLCREQLKNAELVEDIAKAMSQFKGYSRVRNFFCHATYRYDEELNLSSAQGAAYSNDDSPMKFETKRMDRATLNEIGDASLKLGTLNRHLWTLVDRLQKDLGVERIKLPTLPRADEQ